MKFYYEQLVTLRVIGMRLEMQKSKVKKVVSKTFMFLLVLIYMALFIWVFGKENLKVGITILMACLMLLRKDLTKQPVKNLFLLLGINIAIGLSAYVASQNIWLGILIDFGAVSLIGYCFSYAMTKELILAYGLQYLFILNDPVEGKSLIMRWIALIFGSVLIMVIQFIVNAKKTSDIPKESSLISMNGLKSDRVYRTISIFGKQYHIHVVRASYAVRVGILTALTEFVANYYHLAEGKWMTYTVFSITELYSENTKIKAGKRIEGTIIGVIILWAFFFFVKSLILRGILIAVAGCLNFFVVDYRDLMILVTIMSVAPVALAEGTGYAVMQRIFYVAIGIILALLANKYILKKSKSDYEEVKKE